MKKIIFTLMLTFSFHSISLAASFIDLAGSTLRVIDGQPNEIVLSEKAAQVVLASLEESISTVVTVSTNCIDAPPVMPGIGDANNSSEPVCVRIKTLTSANGAYACSIDDRLNLTICKVSL